MKWLVSSLFVFFLLTVPAFSDDVVVEDIIEEGMCFTEEEVDALNSSIVELVSLRELTSKQEEEINVLRGLQEKQGDLIATLEDKATRLEKVVGLTEAIVTSQEGYIQYCEVQLKREQRANFWNNLTMKGTWAVALFILGGLLL